MPLGVGLSQNIGFRDFCHVWTLLPPGASVFLKYMSSSNINLFSQTGQLIYPVVFIYSLFMAEEERRVAKGKEKEEDEGYECS